MGYVLKIFKDTGRKGKDWAKGGYNVGWTQGKGYRDFKPEGPPVRKICIVCKKNSQTANKKCIECNHRSNDEKTS